MVGRMKKFSENEGLFWKSWTLARWILIQILSFHDFFWGDPRPPSGVC